MKKVFLAMALMLISVASFSQSQLRFDVRAGVSAYNYSKADAFSTKAGYTVGVGLDYAFNETWSFQSGLMFTAKGAKLDNTTAESKLKPVYMDIPLQAAVKFRLGENVKLVINAGPYIGVGLGGKITVKSGALSTSRKIFSDDSKFEELYGNQFAGLKQKRFDAGIQYGIGAEFGDILLNLNCQHGLVSPVKNSDSKNIGLVLTLGYRF